MKKHITNVVVGCVGDSGVEFEEFNNYLDAYENYMSRYHLYKTGHIWISEK
jgi:hypothetical protein